ncbi:MAG: D-alanyl-D-alanine carboxypeptidase family protein [Archangium sp.]
MCTACGSQIPNEWEAVPEDPSLGEEFDTIEQGLVSCAERQSTGYRNGNPFPVTLITIDGMLVEKTTGNAFAVMQAAAAAQGVGIRINSGFRTPEEQAYFYACYVNCNCNDCNLAAAPGYSNHQSGTALDLNTANSAVFNWLNANGAAFGFHRTVPSEAWHWEYLGGGPGGGPCSAPPPCDRSAGPFTFSCDGAQSGMACVNVNEPVDPDTWNDNFFCSERDFGMRWSYAGPIAGMDCANVAESAEFHPEAWADNFLCTPKQSPWTFSWSSAGPIPGKSCVHWNEPTDPESWGDNFLCVDSVLSFSNADFTFSMAGPVAGTCVNVNEPSDPDTWADNYFCSTNDIGMKWSFAGPIDGMACANVAESAESQAAIWADNFLCVPEAAPVRFKWSSAGPIEGLDCVRWYDHAETSATWIDNWLCIEPHATLSNPPDQPTPEVPAPDPSAPQPAPTGAEPLAPVTARGCLAVPSLLPGMLVLALLRRRRNSRM